MLLSIIFLAVSLRDKNICHDCSKTKLNLSEYEKICSRSRGGSKNRLFACSAHMIAMNDDR